MCTVTYSRLDNYSTLEKLRRFRESPSPKWAYVEITSHCSHRCIWCYADGPEAPHHMPLDDFRSLLEKLGEIGIFQITLTGGEPLEHPEFMELAEAVHAGGFQFHLASNGELLTTEVLERLQELGLQQIQFNFQGSRLHDRLHGKAVYEPLCRAVAEARSLGIETVLTTVIGQYNYDEIPEILEEGADMGVSRLRVWEVTGNNALLGDIGIPALFARAEEAARKCGYGSCVSYEPEVPGEFQVKCPQLSNLFMSIDAHGQLRFCPVVEDTPVVISLLDHSADEVLAAHNALNVRILGRYGTDTCVARVPRASLD